MAVDTWSDLEVAFDGIPIDKISVSLTVNAVAAPIMAMYFVVAEKHGVPLAQVRGTAQNDILKEHIGRGAWVFPVEPGVKLIGDTIEFCARHAPRYYPVSVCGYHIRESGANPVQEIAYAYSIAREYIRRGLARGLNVDDFAGQISFNFDIFGNFFEQICKFRAARRLWAKITRDEFGAQDPRTMQMKMIAGGGGGGLTIEQPENNIVRGAYYAMISALSGTRGALGSHGTNGQPPLFAAVKSTCCGRERTSTGRNQTSVRSPTVNRAYTYPFPAGTPARM